jgi:hypothetical protein
VQFAEVEALKAHGALKQSLHVLKNSKHVDAHLIGFDSEYTQGGKTLSIQLSDGVRDVIVYPASEPTIHDLRQWVRWFQDVRYDLRPVYLLAFYSNAELGRIGTFWDDALCRYSPVYPGIWNVSFSLTNRTVKRRRKHGWITVPAAPTATVFDVYHIALSSLKAAASKWGLRKLDLDVTNLTENDRSEIAFESYARNDSAVTRELFARQRAWLDTAFDVDFLTYPTVAGASMAAYRHSTLKRKIGNPIVPVRMLALESYWGGHNQSYVAGDFDGKFYQGDAESLYPNAAISLGRLPRAFDWKAKLVDDESDIGGICEVEFRFPSDCAYPCLPCFCDGKLIFPRTGRTCCTLAEVRAARLLGCDIRYHRLHTYSSGDGSLAQYLRRLMAMKRAAERDGNDGHRTMIKLMMNALIGKFGQHRGGTDLNEAVQYCLETGIDLSEFLKPGEFMGHPAKSRYRIGSAWLPEWATLILGQARAIMAEVLPQVKALNCTTDSFICEVGNEITNHRGIAFKPEGVFDHLRVYRTRLYYADGGRHSPKIAHHAIHAPRLAAYEIMRNRQEVYTRRTPRKLPEAMRKHTPMDLRFEHPMTVSFDYDHKRKLHPDGTTEPWDSLADYLQSVGR